MISKAGRFQGLCRSEYGAHSLLSPRRRFRFHRLNEIVSAFRNRGLEDAAFCFTYFSRHATYAVSHHTVMEQCVCSPTYIVGTSVPGCSADGKHRLDEAACVSCYVFGHY